jgi:two-component system sensor histidine kinase CiaH
MPLMFERFHRGDAARTTPGAGLGLSIAQAIVEVHGGSISAEPTADRGTTIVVRLPAVVTPKTG